MSAVRTQSALCWSTGDPAIHRAVESWWTDAPPGTPVLAESSRRRLVRLPLGEGRPDVLIKHYRARPVRGSWEGAPTPGWLARLRLALGRSGPDLEWRALRRLSRAGVPVPRPLASARTGDGDRLLVIELVEGVPVTALLERAPVARRRALESLGRAVAALHGEGMTHGDLHAGNAIVADDHAFLIDFQRTGTAALPGARLRDLGALDFSLAHEGFSRSDRMRVRRLASGVDADRSEAARDRLRAVALASRRRARAYYRSRTRRALRSGRRFAGAAVGDWRGLRLRAFADDAFAAALAAHQSVFDLAGARGGSDDIEVLKQDHRSRICAVSRFGHAVVVKEVRKRDPGRLLADLFRGSPGRRAWHSGHGLAARGIRAAQPLAYAERRRLGIPVASLVVLEDLRPAVPVSGLAPGEIDPSRLLESLGRLVRDLHRRQIAHGDLQAIHVFVEPDGDELRTALIDLEGVRFRRRLTDRDRLQALSELNASLPDALAPAPARCLAFERYARALPFVAGRSAALEALVRLSLERRHRWSGRGCSVAEPEPGSSSRR